MGCAVGPQTPLFTRMVQDVLKRPKLVGAGGARCWEAAAAGAHARPQQHRAGGAEGAAGSTVSPYTAVSILSCPTPSSVAAGAQPGREPAQINSRASKGTSDATPPHGPRGHPDGDRGARWGWDSLRKGIWGHPKCSLAWQVLGCGERPPRQSKQPTPSFSSYEVPQCPGSHPSPRSSQPETTSTHIGDTEPGHAGGSLACAPTLALGGLLQPMLPLQHLLTTDPTAHFGVALQLWESCWRAQIAVPLLPSPAPGTNPAPSCSLGSLGTPKAPPAHTASLVPATLQGCR